MRYNTLNYVWLTQGNATSRKSPAGFDPRRLHLWESFSLLAGALACVKSRVEDRL